MTRISQSGSVSFLSISPVTTTFLFSASASSISTSFAVRRISSSPVSPVFTTSSSAGSSFSVSTVKSSNGPASESSVVFLAAVSFFEADDPPEEEDEADGDTVTDGVTEPGRLELPVVFDG